MKEAMEQVKQAVDTGGKFCGKCGAPVQLAARFCGGCGFDLTLALQPTGQPESFAGSGLDSGDEEGPESSPTGVGTAWLVYLGALALWVAAIALSWGSVATIIYFIAGFVMTRVVMRSLIEFHPMYNTIANVFSAKIWMFLLWPIQMLVLLLKLSVNKVL